MSKQTQNEQKPQWYISQWNYENERAKLIAYQRAYLKCLADCSEKALEIELGYSDNREILFLQQALNANFNQVAELEKDRMNTVEWERRYLRENVSLLPAGGV